MPNEDGTRTPAENAIAEGRTDVTAELHRQWIDGSEDPAFPDEELLIDLASRADLDTLSKVPEERDEEDAT